MDHRIHVAEVLHTAHAHVMHSVLAGLLLRTGIDSFHFQSSFLEFQRWSSLFSYSAFLLPHQGKQ